MMKPIPHPTHIFVNCSRCQSKLICTKHESMAYCSVCGTWNSVALDDSGHWTPNQATGRLTAVRPASGIIG